MTDRERAGSQSLGELITALPRLLIELLKAELAHLRAELAEKAKYAGIGIGLFVGAAAFLFFALGVLVAAAILGLAVVLPGWASALIVFGALLIIAAVLVLIGVSSLKRMNGVAPTETIASVKTDIDALKGLGRYDN
ncbi:phage holin family protein [Leifsonia shinshuensis]|uniref:phage holin family protein n=1 Tax=Leifsonia shinshuensis TaxID=150026 RepID=UPI001F509D73|nr:phage holin family protein [Leifsonia shinshuensis]MCI0156707.1 phage holin family protein [Leifsonia shinshuensis]